MVAEQPQAIFPTLDIFFIAYYPLILPMQNDNAVSPMHLTAQVNDLPVTGLRSFFAQTKPTVMTELVTSTSKLPLTLMN